MFQVNRFQFNKTSFGAATPPKRVPLMPLTKPPSSNPGLTRYGKAYMTAESLVRLHPNEHLLPGESLDAAIERVTENIMQGLPLYTTLNDIVAREDFKSIGPSDIEDAFEHVISGKIEQKHAKK